MNKLVIGTSNFNRNYGLSNKKLNKEHVRDILSLAKKHNIKYLDTALDYNLTPEFVRKNSFKNFKIITKFKLPKKNKKKFVHNLKFTIKSEIEKFQVKTLHAILLHRSNDLSTKHGKNIIKILHELKKKKLIKYIGVSLYSFNEFKKIPKYLKIDLVQIPVNILDQRFLNKKILSFFSKKKIHLQARSIFLQGALLNKSKKMKNLGKYQSELLKYCKKNSTDPLTALISFVKNLDEFRYINIGIDNIRQFKMIIKSWNKTKKLNFDNFKINNIKLIDPRKWN